MNSLAEFLNIMRLNCTKCGRQYIFTQLQIQTEDQIIRYCCPECGKPIYELNATDMFGFKPKTAANIESQLDSIFKGDKDNASS